MKANDKQSPEDLSHFHVLTASHLLESREREELLEVERVDGGDGWDAPGFHPEQQQLRQ